MPKGDKLNVREVILLRELSKGKTFAQAAITAGYTPNAPKQAGFQAFEAIKEKMPQVLERKGLTDDAVIDRYLLPLLEADETIFAQFEGQFTDQRDVKALGIRTRALDMLFRLKGAYADKEGSTVAVQVNIAPDGAFTTKE